MIDHRSRRGKVGPSAQSRPGPGGIIRAIRRVFSLRYVMNQNRGYIQPIKARLKNASQKHHKGRDTRGEKRTDTELGRKEREISSRRVIITVKIHGRQSPQS